MLSIYGERGRKDILFGEMKLKRHHPDGWCLCVEGRLFDIVRYLPGGNPALYRACCVFGLCVFIGAEAADSFPVNAAFFMQPAGRRTLFLLCTPKSITLDHAATQ